MQLSEPLPRLRDPEEVRVIVTNGTAVGELNAVLDDIEPGKAFWSFACEGTEFHLANAKTHGVRLCLAGPAARRLRG